MDTGREKLLEYSLPAKVFFGEKEFVSHCPLLDVYSQGDTKEMALQHLSEAIELFLVTCHEMGTLHQMMGECGFTLKCEGNMMI
jgi:hypothetical protein